MVKFSNFCSKPRLCSFCLPTVLLRSLCYFMGCPRAGVYKACLAKAQGFQVCAWECSGGRGEKVLGWWPWGICVLHCVLFSTGRHHLQKGFCSGLINFQIPIFKSLTDAQLTCLERIFGGQEGELDHRCWGVEQWTVNGMDPKIKALQGPWLKKKNL